MKDSALKKSGRPVDPELWARRQEEILDAATELFAKHGYSGTDTQVLADKLQVGKGTLYRYFPTKQELFLAAVDRVMRRLRAQVETAIEGIEEPLDRITQAIRAHLGFFEEHAEFVELFIQERALFKDRKRPTYWEHRDAYVGRWHDLYRSLAADGRIRDIPVERISDVIGDLLYGVMFTNFFTGRRKPPEEQTEDILDIVFFGILTDSERRQRGVK